MCFSSFRLLVTILLLFIESDYTVTNMFLSIDFLLKYFLYSLCYPVLLCIEETIPFVISINTAIFFLQNSIKSVTVLSEAKLLLKHIVKVVRLWLLVNE